MKYTMCRTLCVLALVALYVGLAHSWDFAVSVGDQLTFYTDVNKTHTVRFDNQNLTALAYDEVHNMLLYVDKQRDNDTICGYDIMSSISINYTCFIERNGRDIQGLAYDPITELLFFTDANERSINWISLKPGSRNNVYGNLLIKMDDGIPSDIAVDSCGGYIYWITSYLKNEIERARFNGSEREIFRRSLNVDPYRVAIDQQTHKICYIDGYESLFLNRADLNNNIELEEILYGLQVTEKVKMNPPNALTVSKDFIFFVIWTGSYKSLMLLPKNASHDLQPKEIIKFYTKSPIAIATNYKIKEQIQEIEKCGALAGQISNKGNTYKLTYCFCLVSFISIFML